MEITVRVYTKGKNTFNIGNSKTIHLNEGELEEIIEDYIKKQYLEDNEVLHAISIRDVKS